MLRSWDGSVTLTREDRVRRSLQAWATIVLAGSLCTACRAAPTPTRLSPDLVAKNVASFDRVWATVRDRHWDPDLGGLDWEGVRAELRPRVERARTSEEARDVLSEALATLGPSPAIIPSQA
jgi:hypothetical protein